MMDQDLLITSAQNPRIKHLLALQQKASLRRELGLTVVEGRRELQHCLEAGGAVDTLSSLNRNLDLNIREYVLFNWKAVADSVDCVDGVEINVKEEEKE